MVEINREYLEKKDSEKLRLANNRLKEIYRKCFEPLKSVEFILLYENIGLNVLSFMRLSTNIWYNEKEKH